MRKVILSCILFIILATPTVLADSVTIGATINESLYVFFNFTTNRPQLYEEIRTQGFNTSTIPNIIEENFEEQHRTNARVIFDPNQRIFSDNLYSITLRFYIAGSDVIGYTLNKTDMMKTFHVETDWRKFQVSFTHNFSLNLERHFGAPLTEWQQVDVEAHPAFEKTVEDPFEMSFRFALPEEAVDIHVEGDAIIFRVPLTLEDTLLNSPFLILGAIIIANIIFVAYRKVRK